MPFSPEQRQAIRMLDMGNVVTSLFLKQHRPEPIQAPVAVEQGAFLPNRRVAPTMAQSIKPKGAKVWAIVTPNGSWELTESEQRVVLAALKSVHGKNEGPQYQRPRDRAL